MEDLHHFHVPTRLVIGPGAVRRIGEEAKGLGMLHPLIVTDPGVMRAGIVDKVLGPFSRLGLIRAIGGR